MLAEVQKGGPGEKAGLKKGDIVVAYQGRQIADASAFRNEVANSAIGEQVKVGIWRDGKKQAIPVTVGNLEDAKKAVVAEVKGRLGVVVRPLNVKETEDCGLSLPEDIT